MIILLLPFTPESWLLVRASLVPREGGAIKGLFTNIGPTVKSDHKHRITEHVFRSTTRWRPSLPGPCWWWRRRPRTPPATSPSPGRRRSPWPSSGCRDTAAVPTVIRLTRSGQSHYLLCSIQQTAGVGVTFHIDRMDCLFRLSNDNDWSGGDPDWLTDCLIFSPAHHANVIIPPWEYWLPSHDQWGVVWRKVMIVREGKITLGWLMPR